MPRIVLNRLVRGRGTSLQAGFRAERSTVEQSSNCRLIIQKHLQSERLVPQLRQFQEAFNRACHEGLGQVFRSCNIEEGLVQIIQALYTITNSAVILTDQIGNLFHTAVGVRQGRLLSPDLFNLFLENNMRETPPGFNTNISVGGRPISNLRIADDIGSLGGSNNELQVLNNRLAERANAHGMEVLVNSADNTSAVITMNG